MASKFKEGDRVRVTSGWTGRSQGNGTVASVGEHGYGVDLDRHPEAGTVHAYESELSPGREKR